MEEKPKNPYKYSALLAYPNSIRLLRLLPADRTDDPIQCQIFNYSLTTPPRTSHLYECLSYVWGDVKSKSTISIDGTELAVTKNLHVALQRLRDPSLDRILWADAACINQEDLEERAQQVQIMAMIYAYASRVIVWLGEEENGSDEAMELIRAEASRMYRREKGLEMDEGEIGEQNDHVRLEEEALLAGEANRSAAEEATELNARDQVALFLRRPWFRRIWVLQEIAAARVMVVVCGTEEVTGAWFHRGLSGILGLYDDPHLHSIVAPIIYLLGDASILRLKKYTTGEPFRLGICPLSTLIDMFRFREATDRRDKVYALLGIASQSPEAYDIKPDYSVEWATVFRELTRSILGQKVEADWNKTNGKEYGQLNAKGCVLGRIVGVDNSKSDRQLVSITPTSHCSRQADEELQKADLKWILHNSTTAVRRGDVICWLEGSKGATIVRSQEHCFMIIVVLARLPRELADKMFFQEGTLIRPPDLDATDVGLAPTQYSRQFHLLWNFDADWTASWVRDVQQSQESSMRISRLLSMARVFEDVNDLDEIKNIVRCGFELLQRQETLPAEIVQHFQDLRQTIPNWSLYLEFKQNLRKIIRGDSSTTGVPTDVELDVVKIRSQLTTGAENLAELLGFFFKEVSLFYPWPEPPRQDLGLKLTFFFEIWGSAIISTSVIGFVEFAEYLSLSQRDIIGHPLHHHYMEIVEILVQATVCQPLWGKTVLRSLFTFAAGNVNRMYCLLRAFVVCSIAPPEWKQVVVEGVLATLQGDFSAWTSLEIEERYTTALDVLWNVYIVPAKDFVAISPSGTFQTRAHTLEQFVNDFRIWRACYEGHASAIWASIVDHKRVDTELLFICKDTQGRWCRVAAFEAAAINGHVECCKALLERGFRIRTTPASWIDLCEQAKIPKETAEQMTELLSTYHPAQWGVSTAVRFGNMSRLQNGKRSDTV